MTFPRLRGFVALGVVLLHFPIAHAATLVRGENRTCRDFADLDWALDHPTSAYFKGWTNSDFDAAETWVTSCVASPPSSEDKERQSLLTQRRVALSSKGETQINDERVNAMKETDRRDDEANAAAAEADKAARIAADTKDAADRANRLVARDECQKSVAYKRYEAVAHISTAVDRETGAQQALDHERRVEEASGTTNLYARRIAGESLVAAQDEIAKWWVAYRQSGGEASSPRDLPRSIEDPCN